jgi:SAM-dependent methyltransferase
MCTPILFDPPAKRKAANRAAHDFLWAEAAELLAESLAALTPRFAQVAELAPLTAHLTALLRARAGTQQVQEVPLTDEHLALAPASVDAIASNLSLYDINDLPGVFIQAYRALRPDGLFIATLPGATSLQELRDALGAAESATRGGISPRVAPFMEVRDAGNLLQRAGFALPVVDSTTLTVAYPHLFALMQELRGAGETNRLAGRVKHFTARALFLQAAEYYAAQHAHPEGGITVTAEIITLTAWKPATSQQQPARRGSGKTSFHEIF